MHPFTPHFTPEDIGKTEKSIRETDTPMLEADETSSSSSSSSDSELGLANVAFSFIHKDSLDLYHGRSSSVPSYFVSWDSSQGSSYSHTPSQGSDRIEHSFFHLEDSKPPPLFIGCTSWWEKHLGHVWISIKTWWVHWVDRIQFHFIPQQTDKAKQHAS